MIVTARPKIGLTLILISLLLPNFYNYLNTSGAILLNGLLILILASLLIIQLKNKILFKSQISKDIFTLYIILLGSFLLLIPISSFIGIFVNDNIIILRDFYELHRPVFYLLIFIFMYLSFRDKNLLDKIHIPINIIFGIIVLIGMLQFFRVLPDLTMSYTKLSNHVTRRISAPFPNPYDYGFVMIFFSIYYFMQLIEIGKKYLLFFLLASLMVLLTQSRASFIGLLTTFLVFIPVYLLFYSIKFNPLRIHRRYLFLIFFLLLTITAGLTIVLVFSDSFLYLIKGIEKIFENPIYNGVTTARWEQIAFIKTQLEDSFATVLLGNGPSKGVMDDVESIYSYFIYRYGLIGLLFGFLIPIFFTAMLSNSMAIKFRDNPQRIGFLLAVTIWLIVVPIISIAGNHTEQIRVSFLHYSLIAFIVAQYTFFTSQKE